MGVDRHAFTDCEPSGFDFALKGRGFQPRRKSHKIIAALAAEGSRNLQCRSTNQRRARV